MPTRKSLLLPFWPLVLAVFGFASCIPIGLPEYVSGLGAGVSTTSSSVGAAARLNSAGVERLLAGVRMRSPRVLVVRGQGQSQGGLTGKDRAPQKLGHQYLLGIVPFTSLYFQHGSQNQLLEIVLDVLEAEGYSPFIVEEENLSSAVGVLRPQIIVRPRLEGLSVNAYDALFFRILSISGELLLDQFIARGSGALDRTRHVRQEISKTRYKRHGHAPMLAYLFQQAVSVSFRQALFDHALSGIGQLHGAQKENWASAKTLDADSLVLISLPQISVESPAETGEFLSLSYGFSKLPIFPERVLRRVVQRGIESGLFDMNVGTISASSEGAGVWLAQAEIGVWELVANVSEVAPVDQSGDGEADAIRVTILFYLKDRDESPARFLLGAVCQVEEQRPDGTDGYWVIGLERATERLTKAFFEQQWQKDKSVVCRNLKDLSG